MSSTNPLTLIVRRSLEKACRDFTTRATALGFNRTKKMLWTRRHPLTVDFIHFHRHGSTYGAPIKAEINIRVHFGARILNDSYVAPALNGPYSDAGRIRAGHYHLRFNAQSLSMYERCVDDLVRFVVDHGEPWFQEFASPQRLLVSATSALNPEQKIHLQAALAENSNPAHVSASLKMLGIKETKP